MKEKEKQQGLKEKPDNVSTIVSTVPSSIQLTNNIIDNIAVAPSTETQVEIVNEVVEVEKSAQT